MIYLDGNNLTIDEVEAVARNFEPVALSDDSKEQIKRSHGWVRKIVDEEIPIYGINTGYGIFSDRSISKQDAAKLSRNLILSHAVGTGEPLPEEVVRAGMLIRANTLAKGHSGVRLELIEILIEMLNRRITPEIPSQGSLGSSGDLAPLCHMALVFTTDEHDREEDSGWAWYHGERKSGKATMEAAGIKRITLVAKEGLAVSNGATFSAAIASLAVTDAESLLKLAAITLAMSLDALKGVSKAFDERIHKARAHPGQIMVARRIRKLLAGSTMVDSDGKVQDAYSLRCGPQVHGAAEDALMYIRQVVEREINAATDNPLLFDPGIAISGGNFHGEPIGMVMDFLSITQAETASISERRVFRMTDGKLNAGLPPMLVDSAEAAGLNSGMMMLQYTAASLVLENQSLASPDSVYSLPTSAEQEDHNANAMTAARHARQIIKNAQHILAIEAYCAARALDLRLKQEPKLQMGAGVTAAKKFIRECVPYQAGDAWWSPEVEAVKNLVINGTLVNRVSEAIDGLE